MAGQEEEEKKQIDTKKAPPKKKKVEKIKTREGKSVKLSELLDEAKARAVKIFEERIKEEGRVQINLEELESSADILGLSSIKYYDLRQNRTQTYVFSFDKMLDPKGNTGVYLIY